MLLQTSTPIATRGAHRAALFFLTSCAQIFCAEPAPFIAPHIPFKEAPHSYWTIPPTDPFSQFLNHTPKVGLPLEGKDAKTQLTNLLAALQIPESSQLLVYSATSLQSGLILPTNPRALYFNEDTYVGYVPGGRMEVAAIDATLGPIFYVSRPENAGPPQFIRSERCMNCHAGRTTSQFPGMVAESVLCTPTGASLDGFRRETVGHHIPLSERLGGWHVTGPHALGEHLGNLMGETIPGGYRKTTNSPGSSFNWSHYLNKTSDLLAHLLFEHQLGFHNLVTLAHYRTREALAAGQGHLREIDKAMLDEVAKRLVRYVLFAEEAALPAGGVTPDPQYLKDFLARRIPTKDGYSLRDMDLHTHIFQNRCSYMIYTPAFQTLPQEVKTRFCAHLSAALSEHNSPAEFAYLSADEKGRILRILSETDLFTKAPTTTLWK